MIETDVAVVGAGLAGLQCARMLGRQGLRVHLLDRKNRLSDRVHTTGIFVRKTLEDFDLPESCLGPPLRRVTLYSPARRTLPLASCHDEFRLGRMSQLYQHFLQRCQQAGVSFLAGTSYLGCSREESGLVLRVECGGRTYPIKARFLVGADGANSRVARDLDLDCNSEWLVGLESVATNLPLRGQPGLHCFLDPQLAPGYLAWVVHDGEEAHLGVGGYPHLFRPQRALRQFQASLGGLFEWNEAKWTEQRGGKIPVNGVLQRIANQHGLLVGDAAGAVSPLTAGGLDACLRLSRQAAQVILRYFDTGTPEELRPYSGQAFRSRFLVRRWMRGVMAGIRDPFTLEMACGVLRLPLFSRFARHIFFGRGSFPNIAMVPPRQHLKPSRYF